MKAWDLFAGLGNRGTGRRATEGPISGSSGDGRRSGAAATRTRALLLLLAVVVCGGLVIGVALAGAEAPALTIGPATAPTYDAATVHATIDPKGTEANWHFDYATQAQFEAGEWPGSGAFGSISTEEAEALGAPKTIESQLEGLLPGRTYHVRIVATNGSGEEAVAVSPATFETTPVAKPVVKEVSATYTSGSTATLEGTVNSGGPNPGEATTWHFGCVAPGPSCESLTGESSGEVTDGADHHFVAQATNLDPHQTYTVALVAESAQTRAEGQPVAESAAPFTTEAVKPDVATSTATEATPTAVVLNGTVNPHNSPLTDCHFLYGAGAALDRTAPCEGTLPSGGAAAAVEAQVNGLAPGTEYSIRLVAANSVGAAESAPGHFGTPPGASAASCPNEAIRVAQHATQTGDCRAWERVSPADKGGGDLIAEGEPVAAAANGNRAAFESRYGFADTVGSGNVGRTVYLADRGTGGWSTHAVTPQGRPDAKQLIGPTTHSDIFSSDLSHVLAFGYELPGATGAAPERMNMYLEDTATRALRTISSSQRGNGEDPIRYWPNEFLNGVELYGASDDLSHVALESWTQLLPTGTAPGYPQGEPLEPSFIFPYAYPYQNVYTWDDGSLHLAGILPDGSAPPEGSRVEKPNNGIGVRGTMSADGSRQAFFASPTAGAPQQLYLRIDHSRTALVSESEDEGSAEEAHKVIFEGMTPDGRNVFFVTETPLLEEDENEGQDLYRWTDGPDPEHEGNLTLITRDGGALSIPTSFGGALVGMSDDGSRVYVHNVGGFLQLWEEGSGIRTIDPSVPRNGPWLTLLKTNPGLGRVSPDGNWVAYVISGSGEMRLYDRRRDTVTTIAGGASIVPHLTSGGEAFPPGFRPRFLSNGGKVFFTSREALVPQDTNGVADVYEYDGPAGKLNLVTSGKGSEPMEFVDASADGSDVFFLTRAQLVASDTDEIVDLYDARVGGGFHEPEPSPAIPCAGEACQAAGAGAAAAPVIGSGAATRGNVKQHRRRCARGRRLVHRHGKVRCVRHQRRHARPSRGGAK